MILYANGIINCCAIKIETSLITATTFKGQRQGLKGIWTLLLGKYEFTSLHRPSARDSFL